MYIYNLIYICIIYIYIYISLSILGVIMYMIQYTSLKTQSFHCVSSPSLHLSISSRFTFCASANRMASVDVSSVAASVGVGSARWCRKRPKLLERTWSFLAPSSNLWRGDFHGRFPKQLMFFRRFHGKFPRHHGILLKALFDSMPVMLVNSWPRVS